MGPLARRTGIYLIPNQCWGLQTQGTEAEAEAEATFPVIMRWFLIQIAYNIENVVKSDKVVRTNGGTAV